MHDISLQWMEGDDQSEAVVVQSLLQILAKSTEILQLAIDNNSECLKYLG